MIDVAIDIETLGTCPGSVITQLAGVAFNALGVGPEFHVYIDPESCVKEGMTIDTSTVLWWMKQSDEARAAFQHKGTDIHQALGMFNDFISKLFGSDVRVWGYGAAFDNVHLAEAYRRCGMVLPWSYKNDRCLRTLAAIYPCLKRPELPGFIAHNALWDARSQAAYASKIIRSRNDVIILNPKDQ